MSDQLLQFLFEDMAPRPLSVSELNRSLCEEVEKRFGSVWVEGEIVNFSVPGSGHWYFTLRDGGAQIRAACFKSSNWRIRFEPYDGLTVRVRGKISMFEPRGEIQIIVDSLEPVGEGALRVAFDQIRDKLEREGLFDSALKRRIPQFPRRIGVVTSPTGAALFDILHVLSRRARSVNVLLLPTFVQGEIASLDIVRAIRLANEFNERAGPEQKIEVLIVGRGGGAAEDLWAFNEEIVARAIRASAIPVISAVGHEVDTTIADFAADVRAATPSAAAELVAAHEEELESRIANAAARVLQAGKYALLVRQRALQELQSDLSASEVDRLAKANKRFLKASSRLSPGHLRSVLTETRTRHSFLHNRHQSSMRAMLRSHSDGLKIAMASLDALSPLNVLSRGFSITEDQGGRIVRSSAEVTEGDVVRIRLSTGALHADVRSKE
jgi:exodeoxyribonuclease VII large subunit